jgi:2-C-methyl-D-erythritol 2,4-cyclodiphosphate synthase
LIEEHNHNYRVGIGTDIHRIQADRKLMLGGVEIPASFGLLGHSDGDVVLHSVIDALLGAAGMNDIGTHFPDNDPKYKNADSKGLVLDVKNKLLAKEWTIVNIDITIKAEQPKLGAFKGQIKRCIASLLGIDFNAVNVKAKTNEGLGAVGNGEAIEAAATALLRKKIKRSL